MEERIPAPIYPFPLRPLNVAVEIPTPFWISV